MDEPINVHAEASLVATLETSVKPGTGVINHATTNAPAFGLGPQEALEYRRRFRGMIGVASKVPLKDRSVLSLLYTPGVAAPCLAIARSPLTSFDYTIRGNTIALLSDGSSAFGFGNIGPMAALPILEDACILFKTLGGVNAFPI